MTGRLSIDFSLPKLWQAWYRFRKGKHPSADIDAFAYLLETNLGSLSDALESGTYVHGLYQRVTITEHKRRDLAVAPVRDRVVHRLLYDELVRIFDHTFLYDVWSCRTNKGLLGAIERTQDFARRFSHSWVWRADITKFFDHVNQAVLKTCLRRRINDPNALWLLESVIDSYQSTRERERERERADGPRLGIPIGNLTSQIFANIYLNELDRAIVHTLRPQAYLRYGDDFVVFVPTQEDTEAVQAAVTTFCADELSLTINPKQDVIVPVRRGLYFLGVEIFPTGRRLRARHWQRIVDRLNLGNVASYRELIARHSPNELRWFNWLVRKEILEAFS